MILQYSPLAVMLGIGTVFLAVLTVFAGKRLRVPGVLPIFIFFVAATIWSGTYAVALASADLQTNILMNAIAYPAIVTIPVVFLLFILWYTEHDMRPSRLFVALIFVLPVLAVLLVWTNNFHHLYYAGFTSLEGPRGSVIWFFERGPLLWMANAYCLVIIISSLLLLLIRYRTVGAIFRTQIHLLLLAVVLPVFTYILYHLDLGPIPGFDMTPPAFMVSGIALVTATLFFELFSLQPLTYSLLVKTLQDGVVATNREGMVTLMNPAAESLVGATQDTAAGKRLSQVQPELGQLILSSGPETEEIHEISLRSGTANRVFDVRSVVIRPDNGPEEGHVLTLRDVTDRKNAENAVRIANRKLNLLSGIVRHDIRNRLTSLYIYLDLATQGEKPEEIRENLGKIQDSAEGIRSLVDFTQKYQNMGVAVPGWQNIGKLLRKASGLLDTSGIQVIDETQGLEIYADPLVEGVIYNLLDNALRYAKGMTVFRVRYEMSGGTLLLLAEDDGTGVPLGEKGKIFERGFGHNTGLGLYLVREILGITEIPIRETGEPGKGARFEISVPPGHYRFPGDGTDKENSSA